MKKWMTAIAVVALGASLAFAQEGPRERRGPGGRPDFVQMFGTALSLTDAQKTQIGDIQKKTREDNAALFEAMRNTMDEYRAAREANDTAKLESLKPVMQSQREQMKTVRDAEMKKIVATLTADQQAKLEKIRAERDSQPPPPPKE
jgi:Spy/CpxP family protein refolding chaperone